MLLQTRGFTSQAGSQAVQKLCRLVLISKAPRAVQRAGVAALDGSEYRRGTCRRIDLYDKASGRVDAQQNPVGLDVFVHITAVQNSGLTGLNEGQRVSYELAEQRNGRFAAVDLSIVD